VQRLLAKRLGLTLVKRVVDAHGEQEVIMGARSLGLTPTVGAASNKVCESICAPYIEDLGGWVNGYDFGFPLR
jgi:hypothetical protein